MVPAGDEEKAAVDQNADPARFRGPKEVEVRKTITLGGAAYRRGTSAEKVNKAET